MNAEQFAFYNRQLAGMLTAGIPLEGAMKQLSQSMRQGALRREMEQMRRSLEAGVPLAEAVEGRSLPQVYKTMLRLGAKGNNLPAVLHWVADYFRGRHELATRLKGMMVYPVIVLAAAIALSVGFLFMMEYLNREVIGGALADFAPSGHLDVYRGLALVPPFLFLLLGVGVLGAFLVPAWRAFLRWRLPWFRDLALSRLASSLAMLMRAGMTWSEAVTLLAEMETDGRLRSELRGWLGAMAEGKTNVDAVIRPGGLIPPMFVWVVANAREELARGFSEAADLYASRAVYRNDLMLYALLPSAVLLLGAMICLQVVGMTQAMTRMFYDSFFW